MSMNNRKIAGFMSAESIYSLAFYVLMVAAIAGVGAGILAKKDTTRAAAAISLLRANFVADTATLGYPDAAKLTDPDYIMKMSGNMLDMNAAGTAAVLPGGGTVTFALRTGTAAPNTGFSINVASITNPEVCNAIGGVGWGTWSGFVAAAAASGISGGTAVPNSMTKVATRTLCDDIVPATAATHVSMTFASY